MAEMVPAGGRESLVRVVPRAESIGHANSGKERSGSGAIVPG